MTKESAKPTAESVLDDALSVLHIGIASIRKQIQAIAAGKGGESKYDPASRIAHLAKQAGSIADSVRKAEAARAKRGAELDETRVLEWFLLQDSTKQGRFLRELAERSKKGSGLA